MARWCCSRLRRGCGRGSASRSSTGTSTAMRRSCTSAARSETGASRGPRRRRACEPFPCRRSRSPPSPNYGATRSARSCFVRARRLPRPARLPQPQLEASAEGGRDHAAAPGLRSQAHVRASCRHLHLRRLPLHGNKPGHDRPPLRAPRDGREHAIRLLDTYRAAEALDVHTVDARWTPSAAHDVNADNGKSG